MLPSLFEEQIEAEAARYEHLTSVSAESSPEALSYFPAAGRLQGRAARVPRPRPPRERGRRHSGDREPERHDRRGLDLLRQAIEEAGAKALELNIYFIPADLSLTGARGRAALSRHRQAVRATVSIPVAVKLSPYFSAIGNMALALERAGADGLVLFNRFYQPDIDLGQLAVLTDLKLSRPNEIRLPLLWLAVLSGRVKASLAATTGVATADEVVKYLLVGADVVMTTSALLRHGVGHMANVARRPEDLARGPRVRFARPDADIGPQTIVTDPPYGLIEYQTMELAKRSNWQGCVAQPAVRPMAPSGHREAFACRRYQVDREMPWASQGRDLARLRASNWERGSAHTRRAVRTDLFKRVARTAAVIVRGVGS